ncbi:hypothetical protein KY290_022587 [Solanum tuberosum]|uniref:Uncharacterized protein n=1 Tax=Solanum tuberosum TaxID=4113 RepID=A0ABQ7V4T2_SOLTU|nr:hypothetical protein KY290_022587 [Solanum tuberosum]
MRELKRRNKNFGLIYVSKYSGLHISHLEVNVILNADVSGEKYDNIVGDLKEADEIFLSRSRGGKGDESALFESIMRKRIIPLISADLVLNQAPEYLSWLLSLKSNYQFGRKKDYCFRVNYVEKD